MWSAEELALMMKNLQRREREIRLRRERERERVVARLQSALQEVAPRFPVCRAWLYGSFLTGPWAEDSGRFVDALETMLASAGEGE